MVHAVHAKWFRHSIGVYVISMDYIYIYIDYMAGLCAENKPNNSWQVGPWVSKCSQSVVEISETVKVFGLKNVFGWQQRQDRQIIYIYINYIKLSYIHLNEAIGDTCETSKIIWNQTNWTIRFNTKSLNFTGCGCPVPSTSPIKILLRYYRSSWKDFKDGFLHNPGARWDSTHIS